MAFPAWPDLSPNDLEQRQLALWKGEKLFQQTMDAGQNGRPFVFYEGPPTANGRPGIHHVFSRTIKDLVCRFHSMRGESVTRIAGWDTHGLPVEIEVEKELKLSGKERHRALWGGGIQRPGPQERVQVSDGVGESLRPNRLLARLRASLHHLQQPVYRKRLVVAAAIAPAEPAVPAATGCCRTVPVVAPFFPVTSWPSATRRSPPTRCMSRFPSRDDPQRELLVWTTTPWTLLSNVAVAVRPDLEYGEYAVGDRRIILATARADLPSGTQRGAPSFRELGALRTFPGVSSSGSGIGAHSRWFLFRRIGAARVVIGADFVTADDGSGLVHLAPAFGADDFQAGVEHGLALVRPVAPDGTFVGTTWPEIEGRLVTARETNDLIIQRLKQEGRWHLTQPHTHTYPHCWRCSSPLIYYARDSWFVRTSAVKARMLELNRQVDWHPPEVGAGRFGEWLENNVDWALSRDRYWGTPLPVWVCDQDSGHVEVIGSYAELAEHWGKALPGDFDPHKPFIDEYSWACRCGGIMRRTPEVIDTWFDSGSMPYAQWHYPFEHQAEFERHFPADFICEGVDQTRGWFYSLLAIATTAFDSLAYRHVMVNELVLDPEGQKMSKSKGNVVDPLGDDRTVRRRHHPALPAGLEPGLAAQALRSADHPRSGGKVLQRAEEQLQVFRRAMPEIGRPRQAPEPAGRPLVDRWLLSRLDATVEAVAGAWERYDVTAGVRAIMDFVVDDVSQWYVRVNRARFWAPDSRPTRRRSPPCTRRCPPCPAAGPGGAVRERLAAPRPRREHPCTSHGFRYRAGAAGPSWRRPWMRCAGWPHWPVRPGKSETSGFGSRWAGCRWRFPAAVRGPGAARSCSSCCGWR